MIDLSHSLPLSLSLLLSFSDYQPTYLPIYLSIYLSTYLSISFSSYQTSYLSLYLSSVSTISCIYLIYLSIHPSIYLSIYLPRETTSQLPKAVRTWFVLYILTSKMCFAPQRRAFFRHHNFQKRSERGVFCTF